MNDQASSGGALVPAAKPVMRRYKLTIAYDGAAFHGWQKQWDPAGADLRTVAGVLEQTLIETLRQPIRLVGASRTDAGVHARGQVAHLDAATRIPLDRLALAINSRLPEDVEVVSVEPVADSFDAIKGAVSKRYRYRLYTTTRRPLEQRNHVYHCWTPIDVARMSDAARRLEGEHDFAGFAAAGHGRLTTVRTIHRCFVETGGGGSGGGQPETHIIVEGSGFLYNMVRIIAGTLVEVGRGRLEPDVVDRVFATLNRREAGPTLPPTGLWLEWIKYGDF